MNNPTIQQALLHARQQLPASTSASLDAQVLLCEVLGVERPYLFAHPEQPLTAEQQAHYRSLIKRRAQGQPVAYILGWRAFYDLELTVTPDVLIPRPETELLLEEALRFANGRRGLAAADIGTGSGALAVAFARHHPAAQVYAVDISAPALTVARRNATRYGAGVQFLQGDLLGPLLERGLRVHLLMANLPYIATDELAALEVARHEPRLALDGGPDGLDMVRRLLAAASQVCHPGALLLLEIGAGQGAAAAELAHQHLPGASVEVLPDYAGHDRILRAQLPAAASHQETAAG